LTLLGCDTMSLCEWFPLFWRKVMPSFLRVKPVLLGLLDTDHEGCVMLWNTRHHSPANTASHPTKPEFSTISLCKPYFLQLIILHLSSVPVLSSWPFLWTNFPPLIELMSLLLYSLPCVRSKSLLATVLLYTGSCYCAFIIWIWSFFFYAISRQITLEPPWACGI
jgi:hypothetical protein